MRLGEAPLQPTPELATLVEDCLGGRARSWHKPHTGLTAAQRFVVTLGDGRSAFVKAAVDAETARMLRTEHQMLTAVDADLAPAVLAWIEHGVESVLITENLQQGYWPADHFRTVEGQRVPVRYQPGQIDLLLAALNRVAQCAPAVALPSLTDRFAPAWPNIAVEPAAFLRLGLCSQNWLDAALDELITAENEVDLSGDALVHNDVRSDNVCFIGDRVVFVDWSNPCRGAAWFDRASLALSLPLETDVRASAIAPDAGAFAAWQAGELARRAYAETDRAPAWLVRVFTRLSLIALEWAEETRDLPPLDGPDWRAL